MGNHNEPEDLTMALSEPSRGSSFTFNPGEAIRIIGERLWQHLQRHVPIELGVSGAIHLAHAAFADLGGDGIGAEGVGAS